MAKTKTKQNRRANAQSQKTIDKQIDWFWHRVRKQIKTNEDGCWIWQGCKRSKEGNGVGYGRIRVYNQTKTVTRVILSIREGTFPDIPRNMVACHKCDVPECINPKHLFIGTYGQNLKDSIDKGRRCPVCRAKLNDNS